MDHRRPLRTSRAVIAVVVAAGLLMVAVVARSTPSHPIRNATTTTSSVPPSTPPPGPNQESRTPRHHSSDSTNRVLDWLFTALVLLLVAAFLWYLPRLVHGRRRPERPHRTVRTVEPDGRLVLPEDDAPVRAAVAAGFAALENTDSDREAIIACWQQVVAALAQAGQVAVPSDTSTQIAAAALTDRGLPPAPLLELAELFREARFSRHPVGPDERQAAQGCLERVRADLAAVSHES